MSIFSIGRFGLGPSPRRSIWVGSHSDTIYGPATPVGVKSALAIIRIDGPQAVDVYHSITRALKPTNAPPKPPPPGKVILRKVICPVTHHIIDPEAAILRFDHPQHAASTVEFHLHGSPAITKALLGTLSKLRHLRLAQPGEFTRRRFVRANGKMDINKILGLKHLIEAETEEQRRWAVSEFDSRFDQTYRQMREKLKQSMALCEAIIDFSEDGSMDDGEIWNQVIDHLLDLKSTVNIQLSQSQRREKISMGIKVSLYGSPNVGKSTLLNYLINREAAIVSPYPGTTRDIIEVSIDYHGFPVILSDTAGLRSSNDPVEEIGINRAKENISKADVRLLLVSAIDVDSFDDQDSILGQEAQDNRPTMILVTKTDLLTDLPGHIDLIVKKLNHHFPGVPIHPISVSNQTPQRGMPQFIKSLEDYLRSLYGSEGSEKQNSFYLTNYQKIHLEKILLHIKAFIDRLRVHLSGRRDDNQPREDLDLVILIEELRLVSGLLAKLSFTNLPPSQLDHHHHPDEISTDEILGEIFSSFCIGK
ncbi:hypothetical protein PTTG_06346 [Puccinia triticina 1-1 BBBD Race 1]|uniref:TrmE-type G domain-containing protein n=2 Tax=Puccinia triticina TaxID=208348 RepID=A0A0C4EZT5_PUCT1|nr:uncharacterized protein PtA15_14A14 [Puccinia triticina]OAV88560.1 hypothetical protein PTTG_06346 [Puccinia triticina 1-1 BBBD Race 1]WAQ91134.1 hypothetical protein PtA15_14A14 [Puccinia triticina]